MHKIAPLLAFAGCLLFAAAPHTASAQGNSRVYIMKKDGKITEVVNGKDQPVTQDVILPNKATVHPDGSIDDKDGNQRKLNEGEYISFVDGRIRKLSTTAATAPASTASTSAAAKPAAAASKSAAASSPAGAAKSAKTATSGKKP
jgi:hypothetical protein